MRFSNDYNESSFSKTAEPVTGMLPISSLLCKPNRKKTLLINVIDNQQSSSIYLLKITRKCNRHKICRSRLSLLLFY